MECSSAKRATAPLALSSSRSHRPSIYKLVPDVHLRWSDVIIGASVTSLLFTIGKQLLAVYLGRVGFESTYGAAWTVVLFLVCVYYSAQLFFLGAEFTKVYARNFGSHSSSHAGSQFAAHGPARGLPFGA
jgi:uncharacterized BrkB/YihY/UPF0761 family membrane protein